MRIGFHNPFLQALGGGEKYFLTMLEEAVRLPDSELVVFAAERPDTASWRRLRVEVEPDAFEWAAGEEEAVLERSPSLDLLVAMTNDVPPLNRAGRAVAMVQFPLRARERPAERVRARLLDAVGRRRATAALASYDLFICNSRFTREHIGRRLGVEASIIPPPVDPPPADAPASAKERVIVSVGRFFRGWHSKRQDVLVEAFRRLCERPEGEDWELHLVGGVAPERDAQDYVANLRSRAEGLPVSFHLDAGAQERDALLARAALFWHAAGFEARPDRQPERLEHFGIATVEAMFHAAVPLVVAAGGQSETIADGRTGIFWNEVDELVEHSRRLIADPALRERIGAAAAARAQDFSTERFRATVRESVLHP